MKSRCVLIALIISLAFNIGFILVFIHVKCVKAKAEKQEPKVQQERTHRVFRDEGIAESRRANFELRRELFQELAKPEVDKDKIKELVENLKESQKALDKSVIQHFISMREGMTAEEAEEFFNNMRARREQGRRGNRRQLTVDN